MLDGGAVEEALTAVGLRTSGEARNSILKLLQLQWGLGLVVGGFFILK